MKSTKLLIVVATSISRPDFRTKSSILSSTTIPQLEALAREGSSGTLHIPRPGVAESVFDQEALFRELVPPKIVHPKDGLVPLKDGLVYIRSVHLPSDAADPVRVFEEICGEKPSAAASAARVLVVRLLPDDATNDDHATQVCKFADGLVGSALDVLRKSEDAGAKWAPPLFVSVVATFREVPGDDLMCGARRIQKYDWESSFAPPLQVSDIPRVKPKPEAEAVAEEEGEGGAPAVAAPESVSVMCALESRYCPNHTRRDSVGTLTELEIVGTGKGSSLAAPAHVYLRDVLYKIGLAKKYGA